MGISHAPNCHAGTTCLALEHVNALLPNELRIRTTALATENKLLDVALDALINDRFCELSLKNRLVAIDVARRTELAQQIFYHVILVAIQSAGDGLEIAQNRAVAHDDDLCFWDLEPALLENRLRYLLQSAGELFLVTLHLITRNA